MIYKTPIDIIICLFGRGFIYHSPFCGSTEEGEGKWGIFTTHTPFNKIHWFWLMGGISLLRWLFSQSCIEWCYSQFKKPQDFKNRIYKTWRELLYIFKIQIWSLIFCHFKVSKRMGRGKNRSKHVRVYRNVPLFTLVIPSFWSLRFFQTHSHTHTKMCLCMFENRFRIKRYSNRHAFEM